MNVERKWPTGLPVEERREKVNKLAAALAFGYVEVDEPVELPKGTKLRLVKSGAASSGDRTYTHYEVLVPDRKTEDMWEEPKERQVEESEVGG